MFESIRAVDPRILGKGAWISWFWRGCGGRIKIYHFGEKHVPERLCCIQNLKPRANEAPYKSWSCATRKQ
jgi:hypothetical protein